jgi:hypothetical protein
VIDAYVKAYQTAELDDRVARVLQLSDAESMRIAMGGTPTPSHQPPAPDRSALNRTDAGTTSLPAQHPAMTTSGRGWSETRLVAVEVAPLRDLVGVGASGTPHPELVIARQWFGFSRLRARLAVVFLSQTSELRYRS